MREFSKGCAVVLLTVAAGCARTDVPEGLTSAEETLRSPAGAKVVVYLDELAVRGELISVESDTLFLIQNDTLQGIPKRDARQVKVFVQEYPLSGGAIAGWTILGTISSVSNGWGAIFSAPLWIITGTVTGLVSAHDANNGDLCYPDDSWSDLGKFARFPQGLLPGIPRDQLKESGAPLLPVDRSNGLKDDW